MKNRFLICKFYLGISSSGAKLRISFIWNKKNEGDFLTFAPIFCDFLFNTRI